MKKLLFACLLSAAIMFAQATGGSTRKAGKLATESDDTATTKTKTKTAVKNFGGCVHCSVKDKKGGKKGKKGSGGTTTPAPK